MPIETIVTQTLALCCNTYVAFTKSKKHVYVASFMFNVFALLTGLFQQDYGLCVSYILIIYRSLVIIYKDRIKVKCKHFAFTFIIAHIVFGIITWKDLWSIIPVITPIFTGSILWYSDNLQLYRVNNILNNLLWSIHNIQSQSYILVVTRVYTIMINIVAILKRRTKNYT